MKLQLICGKYIYIEAFIKYGFISQDHLRPDEYVNVEHLDEDVHIDAGVNFDEESINVSTNLIQCTTD